MKLFPFDNSMKVIMALITAAGVLVPFLALRHTEQRDKEQQIADSLKLNLPPASPPKRTPKAPENEPDKEPEKAVEQQKMPDSPSTVVEDVLDRKKDPHPDETPQQRPKEEPKPYTFWGYFQSGAQLRPGIFFQVNSCSVGPKLVTCSMEAVSPQYDRTFYWNGNTTVTDHDGDQFPFQLHSFSPLQLDRGVTVPFRLDFPVNKNVIEPLTVRLNGYDPTSGTIQRAVFDIGAKQPAR